MEYVQPIRDKKTLETMKKILRSSNLRDYNLFILGINSGLRISDLLTLKVTDEKCRIKDWIVIREKKTNGVHQHWRRTPPSKSNPRISIGMILKKILSFEGTFIDPRT